ncbi:MAG: DUF3418 domain-containing protein, partial [Desulfobacterales bacterium]
FCDPSSDFITLLNIWNSFQQVSKEEKTTGRIKKFCKSRYLSFRRMREWRDIHAQLSEVMKAYRMDAAKPTAVKHQITAHTPPCGQIKKSVPSETPFSRLYTAIHKSILSGFLSNIALKKEKNIFQAPKGKEVMIFPGSTLFNTAKEWIVAAEWVETSRLFARTCANIDSAWLENLGGNLCNRTYLHPHWEKKRGQVSAYEQVSLFGLVIVSKRQVPYGNIDPDRATEIFIQNALIDGDVNETFDFLLHNQNLIDHVRNLEDRVRRRDILVSEGQLFDFYNQRLEKCYDIRTLKAYIKEKKNDLSLRLKPDDIIRYDPDEKELSRFPDRLDLKHLSLNCAYRFDPGSPDDGVTVSIPVAMVNSVPSEPLEWLVPGLYKEKITALIKGLPKPYRKKLVPVADTVDMVINEMPKTRISLITALGNFIFTRFNIDIPASAWPNDLLPDHLKMRISITDSKGEELFSGRNPSLLNRQVSNKGPAVAPPELEAAKKIWERDGILGWDFSDLPESIELKDANTVKWPAYPGLQKAREAEKGVNLRLFLNHETALASHREGVAALFSLYFSKDLKFLKKALKLPREMKKTADYFGGSACVEKRMRERIVKNLFFKNIRTKSDFYAHADTAARSILSEGRELLNHSLPILKAYHEARTTLYTLEIAHNTNPVALQYLTGLRTELSRLIPGNFIDLYDPERLVHLDRYIKALAIRAERGMVDLEKDRAKSDAVAIFTERLNQLLKGLSETASEEKKAAVEALYWLIEEYKVSIFAQELKTSVPVSSKRIEDKFKEIERMA